MSAKKPSLLEHPRLLKILVVLIPSGFIALEAGWIVTEVGRQPWVIYHIMRTSEAVTPVPGLGWSFMIIAIIYSFLGSFSFFLIHKLFKKELQ